MGSSGKSVAVAVTARSRTARIVACILRALRRRERCCVLLAGNGVLCCSGCYLESIGRRSCTNRTNAVFYSEEHAAVSKCCKDGAAVDILSTELGCMRKTRLKLLRKRGMQLFDYRSVRYWSKTISGALTGG